MSDANYNITTHKSTTTSTTTQYGSVAPIAITPDFIGQIYVDTSTGVSYTANSLTIGDWSIIVSSITSGLTKVVTKAAMGALATDAIFTGMCVYQDKLYVGVYNATAANDNTGAKIYCFDGSSWTSFNKNTMCGGDASTADTGFYGMCVYNNKLYIGTYNTTAATNNTGAKILVYNGSTWESVILKSTIGFSNADRYIYSMCVYNNKLYVGTYNLTAATNNTAAQVASYDGANWIAYTKATMGGVNADYNFPTMIVYDDVLYMTTSNTTSAIDSSASKVITWDDATWSVITKATMGGVNADVCYTMAIKDSVLYIGTDNNTSSTSSTGCKLLIYNGATWSTLNKNQFGGVNTDAYISFIVDYKGRLYLGLYNPTATIDCLGAKLVAYDVNGFEVYPKNDLKGLTGDTYFLPLVFFQNRLWMGIYNASATIDITGTRLLSI